MEAVTLYSVYAVDHTVRCTLLQFYCYYAWYVYVAVSPEGSVAVSPEMEIAVIGGTVTFTCSAQGGPDNTYQWQND